MAMRRSTDSFDVVVQHVIGTVTVSPFGDGEPAHVAAFKLIANNDTPGVYEFPIIGTDLINRVTVEHVKQESPNGE